MSSEEEIATALRASRRRIASAPSGPRNDRVSTLTLLCNRSLRCLPRARRLVLVLKGQFVAAGRGVHLPADVQEPSQSEPVHHDRRAVRMGEEFSGQTVQGHQRENILLVVGEDRFEDVEIAGMEKLYVQ